MSLKTVNFNNDWLFANDWNTDMISVDFDDSNWRKVELPHDWSIEGNFSPDASSFCRGAYLPTGMGCYRKRFIIPKELKDCSTSVYFGGIYRNSKVYINGHLAGGREWGYVSFEVDIQKYLNYDGENLLVIKVDNSEQPGCRWYAGSGIYRNVKLNFRNKDIEFPQWGHVVSTRKITVSEAEIVVKYHLCNKSKKRLVCSVTHEIFDPNGIKIKTITGPHTIGSGLNIWLQEPIKIESPLLWDIDSPKLYTLKSTLYYESKMVDFAEIKFGIRSMEYDCNKGFFLNKKNVKIKGVCLHNDGGALGVACSKKTFQRQVQILKTMGCNAIRTAHHPFSEEFLDICDENGMLVLAEVFDEWQEPIRVMPLTDGEPQSLNVKYYSGIFDTCAERDASDIILRDRNHPSLFMWSIGNEVPQMYKFSGAQIAGRLQEIVHNLDETRPVTCGVVSWKVNHNNINLLDVGGYNYPSAEKMDKFHALHPSQPMIVTECFSAQTMHPLGEYHSVEQISKSVYHYFGTNDFIKNNGMAPGIKAWRAVENRPFIMGQFIWTGWDYLGEPTPYDYPAHSSFFGVIDLCGFPKDGYYYYRSIWQSKTAYSYSKQLGFF